MARVATTTKRGMAERMVRTGRPPRERAGEVEERILNAALETFIERGFEGASIDEIAEAAHAGKPSIYARFPGKEALFTAVIIRWVQHGISMSTPSSSSGGTLDERLTALAQGIIRHALSPLSVGLLRMVVGEARRFPELAVSVNAMVRAEGNAAVTRFLGEVAGTEAKRLYPAFFEGNLSLTAQRFVDLVLMPLLMRALFGEDFSGRDDEVAAHASLAVAFFLAACRHKPDDRT
jgi:AcrR family transcriptional regulator